MSTIDRTRLTRLLATLGKPATQGSSNTQVASAGSQHHPVPAKPGGRDPLVLRARLRSRLTTLLESAGDFQQAAPLVTVQEILRWEFGENVVAHPQFERVAGKVAQALLADEKMEAAVYRVIETLLVSD